MNRNANIIQAWQNTEVMDLYMFSDISGVSIDRYNVIFSVLHPSLALRKLDAENVNVFNRH